MVTYTFWAFIYFYLFSFSDNNMLTIDFIFKTIFKK